MFVQKYLKLETTAEWQNSIDPDQMLHSVAYDLVLTVVQTENSPSKWRPKIMANMAFFGGHKTEP